MQSAIGLGCWVLVVFAGLCVIAITFIAVFLPETNGHPVEEITPLFEWLARQAGPAGAAAAAGQPGQGVSAGQGAYRGDRGRPESGGGSG